MKKLKLLSLCMAVIISLPLLSGCGTKDNSNKDSDSDKKDVTISMLFCDGGTNPYSSDWKIFQWIKEATGVTFDIQAVPSSDFETKKNMAFNSGNIPDILCHTFPGIKDSLGGQLLPINKYMDKLPNFEKYLKDNKFEDTWNNLKVADGNIYMIPAQSHELRYQPKQWIIRTDIFEKNNIPIPKTLEDIYEAGKKLKEIYPDSTPITNRFGSNNIMSGLACAYGTIAGYSFGDGSFYNFKTKSYEFAPISQNWKDMITFANKLYKDGVLDKEYATIDSVVYEQKITQGQTFIMYDWSQNMARYMPIGKGLDPDYNLSIIYPPTGYDNTYAVEAANPWTMAMVLPSSLEDNEEHLNDVLSYLDWGYSDEAKTLLTFGKEGESFEIKDGVKLFKSDRDYIKEYGLASNNLVMREDLDFLTGSFSKDQRELAYKVSKECVRGTQPASPLNEDQVEEIQVYQTSLKDYCTSMMEKFINGKEPLSNWDNYVKQCKTKGSDKLMEKYSQALKSKK